MIRHGVVKGSGLILATWASFNMRQKSRMHGRFRFSPPHQNSGRGGWESNPRPRALQHYAIATAAGYPYLLTSFLSFFFSHQVFLWCNVLFCTPAWCGSSVVRLWLHAWERKVYDAILPEWIPSRTRWYLKASLLRCLPSFEMKMSLTLNSWGNLHAPIWTCTWNTHKVPRFCLVR